MLWCTSQPPARLSRVAGRRSRGEGLPDDARRTGPAPERAGAMAADALVVNY